MEQQAQALSSLGMKTAGGRVRGAVARAFTPLESIERSFFYRLTLERHTRPGLLPRERCPRCRNRYSQDKHQFNNRSKSH